MSAPERPQESGIDRRRVLLTAAAGATQFALAPMSVASAQATDGAPATVLITGSNRGIGFAFASQYAALGWRVIATCRKPSEATALQDLAGKSDKLTIEPLDVMDHAMIDGLAKKYEGTPVDVLINNAGIMGEEPSQVFGQFRFEDLDAVMRTNSVGPLKMAESFIDHVSASTQKKIMTLSSRGGSMTLALGQARYFYRASKAAVNNFMVNLAKDVAARGVIVGLLSPGLVANDAIREAMERDNNLKLPAISPDESVKGLIGIVAAFTPDKSGSFFRYNGEREPW